jgi:uncharacterized protein with HEPN domain
MPRRSPALLEDVLQAAEDITSHTAGKTLADYTADRGLQMIVERGFITIGEALNQLSMQDPDTAQRIPDLRVIVDFRNRLVHSYAFIRPMVVWQAVEFELPDLVSVVSRLLAECDKPSE